MTGPDDAPQRQAILDAFAKQIDWCESLGSPFTARVLAIVADDIAAGGVSAELLSAWPGDPIADALALRMAGALHALVLTEAAPDLAAFYPPHAVVETEELRSVLLTVVKRQRPYIEAFLKSPPQTNEVGRSGVLLGGFLTIAQETGLPLRLLEIGASAGLNMVWDRFHYQIGDTDWGDRQSAVTLAPDWSGPLPPLTAPLRVVERRACDVAPIDVEDPVQRLRLRSYVWADQLERLARLDGAIGIARALGLKVEQADAADWVFARVSEDTRPCATVLYHSIMWQYMPAETQAAITACLCAAGGRATKATPLAWLRFEPAPPDLSPELSLTLWPGPREFRLAIAHPHGTRIRWLGA